MCEFVKRGAVRTQRGIGMRRGLSGVLSRDSTDNDEKCPCRYVKKVRGRGGAAGQLFINQGY